MHKISLFVIAFFMYSASVGMTGIRYWMYLQRYYGFHSVSLTMVVRFFLIITHIISSNVSLSVGQTLYGGTVISTLETYSGIIHFTFICNKLTIQYRNK